MPLVNFSNLDFEQIKVSIRDYLKANSNFTDYDYEGSNLSTIIDTLAYNTYINSYNANMVTNEVFIDSATLRENIVSLARNIGYVPRSRKAATANISFNVDASNTNAVTLTLKAGQVLTTTNSFGNTSYTFSIPSDITAPVDSNGTAFFDKVQVYEGVYIQEAFTYTSRNPNQKYVLLNAGIDTSLLTVAVRESQSSSVSRKYRLADSLFEVTSDSPVYYIQEVSDERYEILFGDGVFGKALEDPNYITIGYIISNGASGNNLDNFTFAGRLIDNDGTVVTSGISAISTNDASYGGKSIESVNSIRKYSTQIYASQNRAVTSADFEAIIPTIYAESESVSAFGGEDLTPPAFGKVFISIKPYNGVFLSSNIKDNIKRSLKKYTVAGIVPEIVDLKFLYVEAESNVYYNTNLATSAANVKSIVSQNIVNYSESTDLNKFGARFRYSQYQKIIDNSHDSITSNISTINMRRDMEAKVNQFAEYEICFGNRFYVKNHGHSGTSGRTVVGYNIKSSGFTVSGINGTVYLGDQANSGLKTGSVFLFKLNSATEPVIVKRNIGIIDYEKGEIKLNPINIISTRVNRNIPLVEISAVPYSNDVIGLQDLYMQLDNSNVTVNMIADNIASGNDTSGTNYTVSSSYSNGSLVRGAVVLESTESTTTTSTTTTRAVDSTTTTSQTSVNSTSTSTGTSTGGGSSYSY
jgi:hypothetical protein